jgi:autotransporter-associated beta strand protein
LLLVPAARAGMWDNSWAEDSIWDSAFADRALASRPSWFSAGPSWLMRSLPGSSLSLGRTSTRTSSFVDRNGDPVESTTAENGYVGTLHDIFDPSIFNNISTFAGTSGTKTSGITLSSITATNEWTATANGVWSLGSNWLSGTAPPSGGGTTLVLQFDASGATAYTATNDRGNPFNLNGYIFNSSSSGLITLVNATTNSLVFVTNAGTNPSITQSGSGAATIDQSFTLSAPLMVSGTGSGTLTFAVSSGGRTLSLGANTLTINTDSFLTQMNAALNSSTGGTVVKSGTNTLILNSAVSTFNGGLTLNAGNLNLSADSNSFVAGALDHGALGKGTLTLAGGKIQSNTATAHTISNKVTITGDVTFGSTSAQTGALIFDAITGYTTPPTNPFTLGGAGRIRRWLMWDPAPMARIAWRCKEP